MGAEGHPVSTLPLFLDGHSLVCCVLQIFLSSPLIRPILFSYPDDICVAVQNANTPVPWIDGARSPPLTPPGALPPHPCTLRVLILLTFR